MDESKLRQLLQEVQSGRASVENAVERLRHLPYEDLGYAQLDLHRAIRTGQPEVVFCQFKSVDQVVSIFEKLTTHHDHVLGTRASPEMADAVQTRIPSATYDPVSRLLSVVKISLPPKSDSDPFILVAAAGTADLPVAEEAAQTAEFLGDRVVRAFDVGVAGLHRLLDKWDLLQNAQVVISVAGMEGALTSVIAGLVSCPVVGVPTSVGYGAHFDGLAPLLSMLNACASGVAVVNIDNGFGAGYFAHTILSRILQRVPQIS